MRLDVEPVMERDLQPWRLSIQTYTTIYLHHTCPHLAHSNKIAQQTCEHVFSWIRPRILSRLDLTAEGDSVLTEPIIRFI